MSKIKDLTGQRFNRLLVIEPARTPSGKFAWKCKCDCGNTIITPGAQMKNGNTKSCGCYKNDVAREKCYKHGLSKTKLNSILSAMNDRCTNKNNIGYKNYGARGITVCKEWRGENGLVNFYKWAIENGYQKGLQIDRIDNDGNYEPSNCRWVTPKENLMNKRTTLFYEYKGETKTLQEWAKQSGVPYKRLRARIKECNWDFEKAITTPVTIYKKKEVI